MSLDKNDIQQLLNTQTKEIDARFEKQANTIEKQIDAKLENQKKQIDAKLEEQTKEIERHQKMLLEEFDGRLKVVTEVVVDYTRKIDALMEMVAMNTETLEFIKSMLKRKVDLDEYERLEKRVSSLEKKFHLSKV